MLRKTLKHIVNFDSESLEQLVSIFTEANLKKGVFFARKGEYSQKIAFVVSGVLRAYFRNDKGQEYNKTFFTESNFVGAYSSLVSGQENQIDIDCLTDCKLLIADFQEITNLYDSYPKIERLARILAEQFFVIKEKLQKLSQEDERIIPFNCDISKAEDLDKLVMFVEQNHQDTNILINNAGIQLNYHFAEERQLLGQIEREVHINLLAPLKLIALLIPILKSNDNAAIVNVSSGLGLVPKMQAPVYCGTKAGIHIFSKSLRYQLKDIKVFEIIPPLVDTQMTAGRGKGKISPQKLADEFLRAFQKNQFEISIGKVKLLKFINRLSPALADKIMK